MVAGIPNLLSCGADLAEEFCDQPRVSDSLDGEGVAEETTSTSVELGALRDPVSSTCTGLFDVNSDADINGDSNGCNGGCESACSRVADFWSCCGSK